MENQSLNNKQEVLVNVVEVWEEVLKRLSEKVNSNSFSTWFQGTHIVKIREGVVHLGVSNEFTKNYINQKYSADILRELRATIDTVRSVKLVISTKNVVAMRKKKIVSIPSDTVETRLPFEQIDRKNNLNPRYDFDSFVTCPCNELVVAAAQAVVKLPGMGYNPLLIHGPTGVGKTHALQAIGNKIKNMYPSTKVFYCTSENFAMSYLNAIKENKMNSFKELYRGYDVLIVDDVQFFGDKPRTQEEFFHTFNTLLDANKQLLISSDVHPGDMRGLTERLQSRFSSGMVAHLPQPDKESRYIILREKLNRRNIKLDGNIIELMARDIHGSVRQLEALINMIAIQVEHYGQKITPENIQSIVRQVVKPKRNVSVADVVRRVSHYYNIEEEEVNSATRRRQVVMARQVIMYILRMYAHIPYSSIGRSLQRDHTTVIHSCEKVGNMMRSDSKLNQDMKELKVMLRL